jgi:hypothetical protein
MTFEEYQKSKGRNYSSEADYKEYQEFMKQQGGAQAPQAQAPQAQAPSPQGLQKAAATKKLQTSVPPIKGAPLVDGSGQQVGVANASGGVKPDVSKAQSVLDAYKKDSAAKQAMMRSEDIDRSAKGLELQKQKDAIEFPDQVNPPGDDLSFTGDTKGIMAATSMGMQAVNAKNDMQAIMGGAGAGMQVASMLSGAAGGPVGLAVGAGTALMGMLGSRKAKKEAEKAQKEAEEKAKAQASKLRKLQLLQTHSQERQNAFANLMSSL